MTDEPLSTCPTCGGEVHRIVYPVGLVFKGSGFYSTDNRKSGGAKDSGTEAPSPPPAEAPSEQKAEKKAEPAPAKAAASE